MYCQSAPGKLRSQSVVPVSLDFLPVCSLVVCSRLHVLAGCSLVVGSLHLNFASVILVLVVGDYTTVAVSNAAQVPLSTSHALPVHNTASTWTLQSIKTDGRVLELHQGPFPSCSTQSRRFCLLQ